MMEMEALVERARDGDRESLEALVQCIQNRIYNLAIRMMWHPDDAEDATQEILIQIVTHLGTFRGESTFLTWAYRIASNHLLKARKRRAERKELSFESFGEQLDKGLSEESLDPGDEAVQRLLVEEVKIGCTHGMLLCLDRDHRITYILGEILETTSKEGAFILDITPAAFRKRLSRARADIAAFMRQKCGLVNPDSPCRCSRQVATGIQVGRIKQRNLLFAGRPAVPRDDRAVRRKVREMEELQEVAVVFRNHPEFAAPERFTQGVRHLIDSKKYTILDA